MSGSDKPIMVGNDVLIENHQAVTIQEPAEEMRSRLIFPEVPQERQIPYQNLGALAFNAPATEQRAFVVPSLPENTSRFFSKVKIIYVVIAVTLIGLSAAVIANKQHIVTLASGVTSLVRQDVTSHKAVTAIASPRQLVIHSSDYDSAMTALMTQPITLNVGSSTQTVNGTAIAGWINVKHQGSLAVLTVNTQALSSYLNGVAKTSGQNNAAFNQIANHLLKAQGMTVTVPTS